MKPSHISMCLAFGGAVLLSACATAPSRPSRVDNTYQSVSVKVRLTQKYTSPIYYNQAQLEERLTQCVLDNLKAKNKLATTQSNSIKANIDVNYRRGFMGEAFGKHDAIAEVRFQFDTELTQANTPPIKNSSTQLLAGLGALGGTARMFSSDKEAKDEEPFIALVCQKVTEDLTK